MARKNPYYALDDIGFIGTQEKRSKAQIKKDIEDTVNFIKARKAAKIKNLPPKNRQKLSKAK